MNHRRIAVPLAALAIAGAGTVAVTASADAPPVGKLPKGPVTKVAVPKGELVAVPLPRQTEASGNVWRIARSFNGKVVEQATEGDLEQATVLVFRAKAKGRATIRVALTKGETSPDALKSVTYAIRVTG